MRENQRALTGFRRLSQAISEGEGISLLARASDRAAAQAAERAGADGVVVAGPVRDVASATTLPVLGRGSVSASTLRSIEADAWILAARELANEGDLEAAYADAVAAGIECVIEVRDDEELELALERIDPEIVLLVAHVADEDDDPVDAVLDLLPDVPAGKLAIAEVAVHSREDVLALERAGIDAVLVDAEQVAELFGGEPPAV